MISHICYTHEAFSQNDLDGGGSNMGALSERFPTLTALIWLLSSINSLVINEVRFVAKAFSTITALKAFLQCEFAGVE